MSDSWQLMGERRLVVRSGRRLILILLGVPLFLAGARFLYTYLVLGIAEYIHAGDWAGLFSIGGLFGWLMILVFGLFFLVPGWVLMFFRRVVLIDAEAGALVERKDLRIYHRNTRHLLEPFHLALVLIEPLKGSKSGACVYSVYLVRRDESHFVVAVMDDQPAAEKLGRALAELLKLPCKLVEEGEWLQR